MTMKQGLPVLRFNFSFFFNFNCPAIVWCRYMLAEVMYGGRVTDDYDKRLLINLCHLWFSDDMLEDGFYFYKGYPLLKYKNKEEYLEDIGKLQEFDDPYVFGLHPNAYIT